MGFIRKVATTAFVGTAGTAIFLQLRSNSAPKPQPLTSDAFNVTQDTASAKMMLLKLAVRSNSPTTPKMTLFRLLGCPYCARVKSVLDFFKVEYDEVIIDPISGSGFRDSRYPFAPQIMLSEASSAEGPLIVDSEEIMRALSVPFHFENDLTDERISQTRQWLVDRYQKVTFAALSGTWYSAFQLYPQVVPTWWNYFPARFIGATALYGLSRFKIQPKLAQSDPNVVTQPPVQWLISETATFFDRFRSSSDFFHGGKKPDLADIEMLGVLQSVLNHSETGPCLRGQERVSMWLVHMQEAALVK